ncbi:predicted protein [Sclerotinia sclerotiorum 1980 UF-70]|uniref:Uncharacterized protein n=1 Tax=Sclerotinia sclerotiorum (strain ATCC 18683 / 1980 / Ss-1) TaxID=665079 RepID=A7EYZ2_SCLS1|nr:predicted protein [Sclerotinia sclerotiorum 1980 UF-70]EDN94684.1 predicted protein [Sclerotinia sclerotiorum 1980 UF-70]
MEYLVISRYLYCIYKTFASTRLITTASNFQFDYSSILRGPCYIPGVPDPLSLSLLLLSMNLDLQARSADELTPFLHVPLSINNLGTW